MPLNKMDSSSEEENRQTSYYEILLHIHEKEYTNSKMEYTKC